MVHKGSSRTSPSYYANAILGELDIASVEDLRLLELIAFQRGAIVRTAQLDTAEARLTVGGEYAVITVSTTVDSSRRRRFSIAHELGHLEMHRYENTLSICLAGDLNDWASSSATSNNLEQEANEFAASLLLPEKIFAPMVHQADPSMEHVIELADKFDTSLTATARRYMKFCQAPAAIVWSHNGYVRWFQGTELFTDLNLFVDVNSLVSSKTDVSRYFEIGSSLPSTAVSVKASAWLRSGEYDSDVPIQEQSVVMPNYNGVLTMLLVDDDLFEEGSLWL